MMVTVAVCVDSLMKHVLRRSVRKSLPAMSPGRHDNRRQLTPSSAAVPPVMTSITASSSPVLPVTPTSPADLSVAGVVDRKPLKSILHNRDVSSPEPVLDVNTAKRRRTMARYIIVLSVSHTGHSTVVESAMFRVWIPGRPGIPVIFRSRIPGNEND